MDSDIEIDEDKNGEQDSLSEYEEEGQTYGAERNAYERAGSEDPFAVIFEKPEPSEDKEHKKWVKNLNKRERFYYTIKSEVLPECEEIFPEKINKQMLIDKSTDLPGLEYRNPWAFVLGFMASQGGRKLDKAKILDIINKVPEPIKEKYGIAPADIVRYARYWSKFIV